MKQKINYRNAGECLHATYKDMEGMTLDDAVFILSEPVENITKQRVIKNVSTSQDQE